MSAFLVLRFIIYFTTHCSFSEIFQSIHSYLFLYEIQGQLIQISYKSFYFYGDHFQFMYRLREKSHFMLCNYLAQQIQAFFLYLSFLHTSLKLPIRFKCFIFFITVVNRFFSSFVYSVWLFCMQESCCLLCINFVSYFWSILQICTNAVATDTGRYLNFNFNLITIFVLKSHWPYFTC